jgi:hypothetical protein
MAQNQDLPEDVLIDIAGIFDPARIIEYQYNDENMKNRLLESRRTLLSLCLVSRQLW